MMRKRNDGYVLAYVLIVIMILTIVIGNIYAAVTANYTAAIRAAKELEIRATLEGAVTRVTEEFRGELTSVAGQCEPPAPEAQVAASAIQTSVKNCLKELSLFKYTPATKDGWTITQGIEGVDDSVDDPAARVVAYLTMVSDEGKAPFPETPSLEGATTGQTIPFSNVYEIPITLTVAPEDAESPAGERAVFTLRVTLMGILQIRSSDGQYICTCTCTDCELIRYEIENL